MCSSDLPHNISLVANFFVWIVALAGVITAPFLALRKRKERKKIEPIFILWGSYIFSLFPFVFLVERTTFLYHYFPSLIFGIALASYIIAECIDYKSKRESYVALAVLVLGTLVFFAAVTPFVYGFDTFNEYIPDAVFDFLLIERR